MAPLRSTTETNSYQQRLACTRLGVMLGVCALVLQLLFPVFIGHASAGEWMEICGSDGPVMMQVDLSEDASSECPDCGDCNFCTTLTVSSAVFPSDHNRISTHGAQITFEKSDISVAANPAQFWPDNRGPPTQHKIFSDSACRQPNDVTLSKGGAPWT